MFFLVILCRLGRMFVQLWTASCTFWDVRTKSLEYCSRQVLPLDGVPTRAHLRGTWHPDPLPMQPSCCVKGPHSGPQLLWYA